jgi:hypothetical protein
MSLESRQVATCRRRAYTSAGVHGNGLTTCLTVDKRTRLDSDTEGTQVGRKEGFDFRLPRNPCQPNSGEEDTIRSVLNAVLLPSHARLRGSDNTHWILL